MSAPRSTTKPPRPATSRAAFLAAERQLLKDLEDGERVSVTQPLVDLWTRTIDEGDAGARLEASSRMMDFGGLRAPDDGLGDDPTPAEIAAHYQAKARAEDDEDA